MTEGPDLPSPIPAPNANTLWARVLLDELARTGVRHLVVAPGSRSTPLVLAAARDPRFTMVAQIDERSAAFLALGVGKGTGIPAAVITTSGTAVANLLPAVVEAAQSETPLLLLTADRPAHLRGGDANQAIDQVQIFGGYTRFFRELNPQPVTVETLRHLRSVANQAVAMAKGEPAGPVHLNLPYSKPLEPVVVEREAVEDGPLADSARGRGGGGAHTEVYPHEAFPSAEAIAALVAHIQEARRPLLVAGPSPMPWRTGPALQALARHLGAPLLADPLSGARSSDVPGAGYDLALRSSHARTTLAPDLIVRFGQTPSSASLTGWLASLPHVPHLLVDGGGRWKDHLGVATAVYPGSPSRVAAALVDALPTPPEERASGSSWWSLWEMVDQSVREALRRWLSDPVATAEPWVALVAGSHAAQEARGLLFVSNSMPIRDVDAVWPLGNAEMLPLSGRILGNRGASGIDGVVSTALGVAWGTGAPVTLLIGDLALLHDQNGLLVSDALSGQGVRVHIVVINNDGGGIFHHLPASAYDPPFTEFVVTPHGRAFQSLAEFHGLPYRCVPHPDPSALRTALKRVASGSDSSSITLVEVQTHRSERPQARALLEADLDEALRSVLWNPTP